jgi:hypothetical protein
MQLMLSRNWCCQKIAVVWQLPFSGMNVVRRLQLSGNCSSQVIAAVKELLLSGNRCCQAIAAVRQLPLSGN